MNTENLISKIYHILDEKKADDITVIDIRNISTIADYFIVAGANNQNQLLALQDGVDEMMTKEGIQARGIEGNRSSTWILMDYEDIVVHLFSAEDRVFYHLERIWKDGIVVPKEELIKDISIHDKD